MNLKDNPFYILGVSPSANRAAIMDAAEEMSLLQDSDASMEAQNILINPSKRLEAELGWFLDVHLKTQTLKTVIDTSQRIDLRGLSPLSKLNAAVYNCSRSNVDSASQIGDSIIEIDALYAALNVDDIVQRVNACRSTARFPEVHRQDVAQTLNERRDEIERALADKLSPLSQGKYVETITHAAEELVKSYRGAKGTIISGLIDQYEVRIQSELERKTQQVLRQIDRVWQMSDEYSVESGVRDLIRFTQQWDEIAQPIQLKSQASGIPHRNSEHLGRELRGLVLYLNNEKGMSDPALTLAGALKGVFAELEELSGLFKNDLGALQNLVKRNKAAADLAGKLETALKIGDSIVDHPSESSVSNFVKQIIDINKQVKNSDLPNSEKSEVREMLYYAARTVSVTLHNEKHQTVYAAKIITEVAPEFSDLWNLKSKIEEDKNTITGELAAAQSASTHHNSSSGNNWGCLIWVAIVVFIYFIWAMVSNGAH